MRILLPALSALTLLSLTAHAEEDRKVQHPPPAVADKKTVKIVPVSSSVRPFSGWVRKIGNKTANGIEKGANATAKGVNKGAEKTAQGLDKAADKTAKGANKAADKTSKAIDKTATKTKQGVKKASDKVQ